MYDETVLDLNNSSFGKGYCLQPWGSADYPYLNLDYSGCYKNLMQ